MGGLAALFGVVGYSWGVAPGWNEAGALPLVFHTTSLLSPLAEPRRIVAKVEQLMTSVDALETQLAHWVALSALRDVVYPNFSGVAPSWPGPGLWPVGTARQSRWRFPLGLAGFGRTVSVVHADGRRLSPAGSGVDLVS